jgi:hypothetical protein
MIIEIRFHEDLPTRARNRLRYAMEMGVWRAEWRAAAEAKDYEAMDRLSRDYERVGLP